MKKRQKGTSLSINGFYRKQQVCTLSYHLQSKNTWTRPTETWCMHRNPKIAYDATERECVYSSNGSKRLAKSKCPVNDSSVKTPSPRFILPVRFPSHLSRKSFPPLRPFLYFPRLRALSLVLSCNEHMQTLYFHNCIKAIYSIIYATYDICVRVQFGAFWSACAFVCTKTHMFWEKYEINRPKTDASFILLEGIILHIHLSKKRKKRK